VTVTFNFFSGADSLKPGAVCLKYIFYYRIK